MRRLGIGLGVLAGLLLIAFLFLQVGDTDPDAMRAKYGVAPSQFVTLANNQTIHVRDEGPRNAPALVLLHGSNADLHTWQPWVDRLKARYRIVRFDQRGHGLTGPALDARYARKDFSADVGRVADALGIDRFAIGGNSMGGGIALQYALANPDRVSSLVLVDAAGAPRLEEAGGNIGFTLARMPGVSALMGHITPRGLIERSLRQSVGKQTIVTEPMIDRYWELLRYPGNRQATAIRFRTEQRPFSAQELGALTVPTVIIWGEEDDLIPLSSGRWLAARIPEARLEVLAGIGHLPMEEAPDATATMVDRFLSETSD